MSGLEKLDYPAARPTPWEVPDNFYDSNAKLDLPGTLNEFQALAQDGDLSGLVSVAARPFRTRDVATTTLDAAGSGEVSLGTVPTGWQWDIGRLIVRIDAAGGLGTVIRVQVGNYLLDVGNGSVAGTTTTFAVADETQTLLATGGDEVRVFLDDGPATTGVTVTIQYLATPLGG